MKNNYVPKIGEMIQYEYAPNKFRSGEVLDIDYVDETGTKFCQVRSNKGKTEYIAYECIAVDNSDNMHDKSVSNGNLTFSYLSRVFGESFVWTSRTLEIVGYSDMYNAFVVIADGMCYSGCGWHTLIYSFIDAHITAKDWFNDKGKYYTGKDVHTQEFWLNGVDVPTYKL